MTRSAHLFAKARHPEEWYLAQSQGEGEFVDSWNIFVWINQQNGRDNTGEWPVSRSLDELDALTKEERESILMMLKIEKFSK
jgi:hypothetical protein